MELSVVSAIAPSSGRSRSKRPTNSAEKCCASAAEPPLPQASTLPPLVTQASTACTAAAIGLDRVSAAWYFRSALSMKCCWMRASSMAGDDNGSLSGIERRLEPVDLAGLDTHHVEAAGRGLGQAHEEMARGKDDPALLGGADARGRAAIGARRAFAHFDEDECGA